MPQRACLAVALLLALADACLANAWHPQDGPHADLRVAIEDDLVRFSAGVNLAFLDEAIDVPREALNQLGPDEADRALAAFQELLITQAPCVINGDPVEPVFERLEIFTDPDPGMIAIFPNMGARALIRATAVMRFDAPETIETVELTWPAYPFDQLAERMEAASGVRPRMYFEAVLTAAGKSSPARFTHAEPTLRWSRAEDAAPDPLRDLPAPATTAPRDGVPIIVFVLGGMVIITLLIAAVRRTPGARTAGLVVAALVAALLGGLVLATQHRDGWPLPGDEQPLVCESDAERIFLTIHESLYRAFDYTAESDIYDRLEMALDGDLLAQLYEQIRLSLLQAEEEMKIGVVTGLDPLDTSITAIDPTDLDPTGRGFDATHRWRVDGTVYHWGHSHTRAHVYEANYRVTFTEHGWRFTEHELLSQRRIDPADGAPVEEADAVQQILDRLGRPDI